MGEQLDKVLNKLADPESYRKAKRLITSIDWTGKRYKERVYQEKGRDFPLAGEKVVAVEDIHEEFLEDISKGTVLTVESYDLSSDKYSFRELDVRYYPYLHEYLKQYFPSKYFKRADTE